MMKVMIDGRLFVPVEVVDRAVEAGNKAISAYRSLVIETNTWSIPPDTTEATQDDLRSRLNGIERTADRAEKEIDKVMRDLQQQRAS